VSNTTINLTFLNAFTSGNSALQSHLIQKFVDATPSAIADVKSQLAAGLLHDLSRTAHSLKPQLSYMGIENCLEEIKQIEHCEQEQIETTKLADLIKQVENSCTTAIEELKTELEKL